MNPGNKGKKGAIGINPGNKGKKGASSSGINPGKKGKRNEKPLVPSVEPGKQISRFTVDCRATTDFPFEVAWQQIKVIDVVVKKKTIHFCTYLIDVGSLPQPSLLVHVRDTMYTVRYGLGFMS